MEVLPAEPGTIVLYIAACAASLRVSTIERRLMAISQRHRAADLESPVYRTQYGRPCEGCDAGKAWRPLEKKTVLAPQLRRMLLAVGEDSTKNARDRALLLVGFLAVSGVRSW